MVQVRGIRVRPAWLFTTASLLASAASGQALAQTTGAPSPATGQGPGQGQAGASQGLPSGAQQTGGSTGATTSAANPTTVGEVIVTAQRREETLQNVPIAVTALSGDSLKAQRIDNAANLNLTVPNLTFQPAPYGEANFSIRGIGYQIVSAAGEAGVAVHENNAPLTVSRLAEADFFDIQRVEVLRGPQGTLYGRNATGGVVNDITAKPSNRYEASLTGEYGTYDYGRVTGFVNAPLGDVFRLRAAGIYSGREGFQTNAVTGNRIDARDLWAGRLTLAFTPTDRFRGYAMWEHYSENDSRTGGLKTVCLNDPGPTSVGGVSLTNGNPQNAQIRNFLSQGCAPTSIYDPRVQTGVSNAYASFAGRLAALLPPGSPVISSDVNAGASQPADPRGVALTRDPTYRARNDIVQLNLEYDLTPALKLDWLTTFSQDHLITSSGGIPSATGFNVTPFTPGGVFTDPQLGASSALSYGSYQNLRAAEWSSEARLQSSFSGPVNFSVGAIWIHLRRYNDVFIPASGLTIASEVLNFGNAAGNGVDPNATPVGGGHNYFESLNPYRLTSRALFGEVNWQINPDLRLTAGLRYTDDDKKQLYVQQLILQPGFGYPASMPVQAVDFRKATGRLNLQWTPRLGFTDASMFYASYSRGYKAGGFNPPDITGPLPPYAPEFVNAYELGTKNQLLGRTLQLNGDVFYYDYQNYQYSRPAALTAFTTNVDAKIWGAEFEGVWNPLRALRLNANLGYLHTKISNGPNASAPDPYNLTGGDPNLSVLKNLTGTCVVNTAGLAGLVSAVQAGALPATALAGSSTFDLCGASGAAAAGAFGLNPIAPGVPVSIAGNQLPSSPHWTVALGAQYSWSLPQGWDLVPRVDYHYTSGLYADVFNDPDNRVRGWYSVNATVTLSNQPGGWQFQAFARNIARRNTIVGAVGPSATVGNTRTIVLLDPTTYGLSATKTF
jgi:outer membrane receptor protein involved in Fe transport